MARLTKADLSRIFAEHPDDPLPRRWIWWSVPMMIGSFAWGWHLGDWGFFQNVLASLVLVAPGLFATNVIATHIRRQRAVRRVNRGLMAVLDILAPAFGLIVSLAYTVSPRVPKRYELKLPGERVTVQQMIEALAKAQALFGIVPVGPDLEPGPHLESGLEIPVSEISNLPRRVRGGLRRMAAVHEFPRLSIKGDDLVEALSFPLPCQVREGELAGIQAGLKVVDQSISVGRQYRLGDIRRGDLITVSRADLCVWATNVLHPLSDVLREIAMRADLLERGIVEEDFSSLSTFEFDFRLVERPR